MLSQLELSKKAVGPPYKNPETGIAAGAEQPDDLQRLRGNQISRADDDAENIRVGLYDIDSAIIYYLNEVIRPRVTVNGNDIAVPIVYGDPEKWQAVQKEGFYRDKNGKRQVPVIIFKRDDLSRNRNVSSKVDANDPHNFYVTSQTYTKRNQYSRFGAINGRLPEKSLVVSVVPDYVKLTYSCVILTDLMVQMNSIIEAINFASDSYWGDKNRFKFQSFIDSFKTDVIAADNDDRIVKTTFTVKLNGYIVPDTVNSGPYTSMKKYLKTHVKNDVRIREVAPVCVGSSSVSYNIIPVERSDKELQKVSASLNARIDDVSGSLMADSASLSASIQSVYERVLANSSSAADALTDVSASIDTTIHKVSSSLSASITDLSASIDSGVEIYVTCSALTSFPIQGDANKKIYYAENTGKIYKWIPVGSFGYYKNIGWEDPDVFSGGSAGSF